MRLGGLARDPQADAEAAEMLVGDRALESPEDSFLVLGLNPDSVIPDGEGRRLGVCPYCDFDRLTATELDRIRDEVADDRFEENWVPKASNSVAGVDLDLGLAAPQHLA